MGTQDRLIEILKEIIIAEDFDGHLSELEKRVQAAETAAEIKALEASIAKNKTPVKH